MSKAVLVRGARQLLTLNGPPGPRRGSAMRDLGLIEDGALLILDGVIREVGPSRRVERLAAARDAMEIDVSGKAVMPGFVDCHTRLVAGPPHLDSYEALSPPDEDLAIRESVQHVRSYSKQRILFEGRKQLRQFIKHGTTSLDARTGFGLNETVEFKLLRAFSELDGKPLAISPGFFGAAVCPAEFADRPAHYVEWVARHLVPEVHRRRLARFVDVACGTRTGFSAELAAHVLAAAHAHGLPVRVSTGDCAAAAGAVALALANKAAAIDGLVRVDQQEVTALASSETVVTLLPGRTFHSGSPVHPPARKLIDGGAAVAIASGFDSTTSPSCSMPMMMSLACTQMRMKPAEAVAAATINAACALRLDHDAGSLQAGKSGDLVVFHSGDYREAAFRFGINPVAMVVRRGEIIYPRMEAA